MGAFILLITKMAQKQSKNWKSNSEAYVNLAIAQGQNKKYDEAIKEFTTEAEE